MTNIIPSLTSVMANTSQAESLSSNKSVEDIAKTNTQRVKQNLSATILIVDDEPANLETNAIPVLLVYLGSCDS
jgi:hypothetical protein